jgi:regulator of protease activity HflC (stomatin/prohibitin superfamily)
MSPQQVQQERRSFWEDPNRGFNWVRLFTLVVVVGVILVLALGSFYLVPAGSVGVVTRFGAVNRVAYPGIGLKIPIVEAVVNMDVRTQIDQSDAKAASQDLQSVTSTIAVNYHLDPTFAVSVYQSIGPDYQEVVIAPAIQNIFKAVTAQYTAEQLITNREGVRSSAEAQLKTQLVVYHVIVENFNIVNFDFSADFDAAIEAKQVAQQQVETAKQQLAKAQVDAQTAVAQAQGQADAQAALKNTGALNSAYLQYLALQKWDGHLPSVTGGAVPFIQAAIQPSTGAPATTP